MVVGWLVLGWWWVVGGVVVMVTMLVMLVRCRITTVVITTHILSLGLSCWWATCHDLVGLRSAAGACSQFHQYPICPYLCNYHVQPWVLTMNSIWVRLKVGHPQFQRIATIFPHFNDPTCGLPIFKTNSFHNFGFRMFLFTFFQMPFLQQVWENASESACWLKKNKAQFCSSAPLKPGIHIFSSSPHPIRRGTSVPRACISPGHSVPGRLFGSVAFLPAMVWPVDVLEIRSVICCSNFNPYVGWCNKQATNMQEGSWLCFGRSWVTVLSVVRCVWFSPTQARSPLERNQPSLLDYVTHITHITYTHAHTHTHIYIYINIIYLYISIWVNYNDLTATSLGIMVDKGNHPQMTLIKGSEIFLFAQIDR